MAMTLISTITSTGSSPTMAFTNIPATYTDLLLVASIRTTQSTTITSLYSYFGTALAAPLRTGYNSKNLIGSPSLLSYSQSNDSQWNIDYAVSGANSTSNTFGTVQLYMPNYTSSVDKYVSAEGLAENNSATAGRIIFGGSNTSGNAASPVGYWAIELNANNFVAGSTASLYGILKGSGGANVS